jgi:DNA polymerase-3 subunit chi
VFLQPFTNGVPWAHLDIAGVAWASRDLPLAPKGATGYGVRLLDRLVAGYEAAVAGVTEVGFYHLTRMSLEEALPRLLEKVVAQGKRAVLRCADEERLEALNRALWTYTNDSFLPHGSRADGHADEQPIYLTTGDENPNGAAVLVLVDAAPPTTWARSSAAWRCSTAATSGPSASPGRAGRRSRPPATRPTYWQQNERGGWVRGGGGASRA